MRHPRRNEYGRPEPALVALAFGEHGTVHVDARTTHLAFLGADAPRLDLDDPAQRDFGDYELLELIGEGGMGSVYRARQKDLDRDVAIKLLSAGPWASPEFVAGFKREAQNAARLQHPNIVAIHELGDLDGLLFFAMQLMTGRSLADHIAAEGPLPPRVAASLLRDIARAVEYAHRLGVLHLDLKPGNILLDEDGSPRVADFGLARRLGQAGFAASEAIIGTPGYMAPEQARPEGAQLGPATDSWGLGAIGYELLTGRPPFQAETPQATLRLAREGVPENLRALRPDLPRDLAAIITHCLARAPEARYASAGALADDLGRYLDGHPVGVRPLNRLQRIGRWARREPRLAVTASAALAALITGLATTSLQWRRAEQQTRVVHEQLWQKRLDDAAQTVRERSMLDALPALIENLAEQEAVGDREAASLSRTRIGSLLAQASVLVDAIPTGEAVASVLIDPEGDWVAVGSDSSRVRLYDLATGELRWMSDLFEAGGRRKTPNDVQLSVTGDGRYLIADDHYLVAGTPNPSELGQMLLDIGTGALHVPPVEPGSTLSFVRYSRNGRYALIDRRRSAPDAPTLQQLVRTNDWGAAGQAFPEPHDSWPGLSSDGLSIARVVLGENSSWESSRGVVEIADARTGAARGRYAHPSGARLSAWHWSRDGRILALGFEDGGIVLMDAATASARPLRPQPASRVFVLQFSGDDGWLAAGFEDSTVQAWDVTTGDLVSVPVRLEGVHARVVRPDRAHRSLFAASAEQARVWRIDERASRPPTVIADRPGYPVATRAEANAAAPGTAMFATAAADGLLRLWRYRTPRPLAGTAPAQDVVENDWTARGRFVATVSGNRAGVIDSRSNAPAGPAITLPQAVGFATPAPGTSTLISTAGFTLYGHDWRNGQPRFPPITLAATPSALLTAPQGGRILVAHHDHASGRNQLVLESFDAHSGRKLGQTRLQGSTHLLLYSGRGATVLAFRLGEVHVLDAVSLAPRFPALVFGLSREAFQAQFAGREEGGVDYPADFDWGTTAWPAIGEDERTLWVVTIDQSGISSPELRRFDARSGAPMNQWTLPVLSPGDGAWALSGQRFALLLSQFDQLRLYAADGSYRILPVHGMTDYVGLAESTDLGTVAVGMSDGAQLFHLGTRSWLGPRLRPDLGEGQLTGVAIAPQGEAILVRSSARRIWRFDLPKDPRPVAELASLAALLKPADVAAAQTAAARIDARMRAALRAQDPGPPAPVSALGSIASEPGTSAPSEARFVDLRPRCNLALDQSADRLFQRLQVDRVLPPGRHRLLGVDYDVRCGILLAHTPGHPASEEHGSRVSGIAIDEPGIGVLHLLMLATTNLRDRSLTPYATLELSYRDGSRARLPIVYGDDIEAWFEWYRERPGARIAYVGLGSYASNSRLTLPRVYEVRVANPHPDRPVASLALESVTPPWSTPLLLAVTLEPPP